MKNFSMKLMILKMIKKIDDDELFALASQLSYSLLLSFFPFIIFLMTIIGYLKLDNNQVLVTLKALVPENAYDLIASTVLNMVNSRDGNLLSFSLILTIWSASTGFSAVIRGLNKAYNEKEKRGFFKTKLVSLMCTFGITLIIIINLLALVFGNVIGNFLLRHSYFDGVIVYHLWNTLRYVIMVGTMIFVFASLYHYTPSKRMTWKEVLPGALFSTIGWIIVSLGFSYYVNNFANYSRLYGGIGAVIVLMTWIFLSSIIILLGGEINAILSKESKLRGTYNS